MNHESSGSRQGQRETNLRINTELNFLFSHSKPSGLTGDVDWGLKGVCQTNIPGLYLEKDLCDRQIKRGSSL